MSLYHKGKNIGGFPEIDSVVTSDSNNPVSSKAVYEAIVNTSGNTELCEATLGYICKNLLPYPYFVSSRTSRGIRFVANQDGSVNFEGVADNELSSYMTIIEGAVLPAGTYTVSAGDNIHAGLGLYFYDDEGLSIPYSSGYSGLFATSTTRYIYTTADGLVDWKPDNTYGYEKTFTIDKSAFVRVQVRGVDNTCTDTVSGTVYPMLRYASIEDGTYEPYKANVGTLIEDIQSDNAIAMSTLGYACKNLVQYPYHLSGGTTQGLTYTVGSNGVISVDGTANATTSYAAIVFLSRQNTVSPFYLKAGKYILTGCPADGSDDTHSLYIERSDADGNYQFIAKDIGNGVEFEIKNDEENLPIQLAIHVKNGITVNDLVFRPMIRYANINDATYEPYRANVDTRLNNIETDVTNLNEVSSGVATINSGKVSAGTVSWYKCGKLVMVSGHVTISSVIPWSDVTTAILSGLPPAMAGVNVPFGKLYATMGSNGVLSNSSLNDITAERHGIAFTYIAK